MPDSERIEKLKKIRLTQFKWARIALVFIVSASLARVLLWAFPTEISSAVGKGTINFVIWAMIFIGIAVLVSEFLTLDSDSAVARLAVAEYKKNGNLEDIEDIIARYEEASSSERLSMLPTLTRWIPMAEELRASHLETPKPLEEIFQKLDRNWFNLVWLPMRLERRRRRLAAQ